MSRLYSSPPSCRHPCLDVNFDCKSTTARDLPHMGCLRHMCSVSLLNNLCVWGGGVSCVAISYRAQLGRVGGSRWVWVLQIKFPCHYSLSLSLSHTHTPLALHARTEMRFQDPGGGQILTPPPPTESQNAHETSENCPRIFDPRHFIDHTKRLNTCPIQAADPDQGR